MLADSCVCTRRFQSFLVKLGAAALEMLKSMGVCFSNTWGGGGLDPAAGQHDCQPVLSPTWCQDGVKSVCLPLQLLLFHPGLVPVRVSARGSGTSVYFSEVMLIVSLPQLPYSARWSLLAYLDRWAKYLRALNILGQPTRGREPRSSVDRPHSCHLLAFSAVTRWRASPSDPTSLVSS